MMIGSTCSHHIPKWEQKKTLQRHVYDVGANEQQILPLRFFPHLPAMKKK